MQIAINSVRKHSKYDKNLRQSMIYGKISYFDAKISRSKARV